MTQIINSYNSGGIDEGVLTGTGKGGILSDGYLRDEPLASYIGDDETAVFVASNSKKGVRYEKENRDEDGEIRPGDGYRAFAVATDVRLLFIIGDNRSGGSAGDHSISIPLSDIELVDASDGVLSEELRVVTAADVRWWFPSRDDLEAMVRYLDQASMAWTKVERRLDVARKRVVDAGGNLESKAYDEAMEAIEAALVETDAARRHERELCESGVHAMADRIEKTEERIRESRLKILRARAAHNIDEGEQLWRDEAYDAAYEAYSDAHDDYVEILSLTEPTFEESQELRDKIARVERNVAYLESAPIDSARRARERATAGDDPGERADHLETALKRYRTALELDWGRDIKRFECDADEVRDAIDAVASELVAARQAEAARHVELANGHYDAGRYARAREEYVAGRSALRAMLDTARELVPGAVDEVTRRLGAIDDRLAEIDDHLDDPTQDLNRDLNPDSDRDLNPDSDRDLNPDPNQDPDPDPDPDGWQFGDASDDDHGDDESTTGSDAMVF